MSDVFYRLIPKQPEYIVSAEVASAAAQFLETSLEARSAGYVLTERPVFVDCGDLFERMLCPYCKTELSHTWWIAQMDACAESGFSNRNVQFPCCSQMGKLENIDYRAPCGIARTVLEVRGARRAPDSATIDMVRFLLQCSVRLIVAHY